MRIMGIATLILFLSLSVALFKAHNNRYNKEPYYDITLPTLLGTKPQFSTSALNKTGRPYLINVFASWCTTCIDEHKTWVEVARKNFIDIYGIDYIDVEQKALAWLKENGNPYVMVAADYSGLSSKKLGVSGVPETFVFDKKGRMILHIAGSVTTEMWQNHISKLIT